MYILFDKRAILSVMLKPLGVLSSRSLRLKEICRCKAHFYNKKSLQRKSLKTRVCHRDLFFQTDAKNSGFTTNDAIRLVILS